jgi:hypothetical protein
MTPTIDTAAIHALGISLTPVIPPPPAETHPNNSDNKNSVITPVGKQEGSLDTSTPQKCDLPGQEIYQPPTSPISGEDDYSVGLPDGGYISLSQTELKLIASNREYGQPTYMDSISELPPETTPYCTPSTPCTQPTITALTHPTPQTAMDNNQICAINNTNAMDYMVCQPNQVLTWPPPLPLDTPATPAAMVPTATQHYPMSTAGDPSDPCPMTVLPNANTCDKSSKDTNIVINTIDESDTPPPHVFHQGEIYYTNAGLQLVKFNAKPGDKILVEKDGLSLTTATTTDQSSQASSGSGCLTGTFNFSINLDNLNANNN